MAQLECSWAKGWWLVMHQSLFSRRLKEWKKVELAAAAAAALVSLPYAPRYSCCWWCSIPTMNTQRLSYIAQLHKTFVLQQSSGWITDQTCIASIMGSTTFWRLNFWMHILFLGLSYQNNLAQIIHINNNDWDWTLLFAISAFALTGTTVLLLNIMMSYWF